MRRVWRDSRHFELSIKLASDSLYNYRLPFRLEDLFDRRGLSLGKIPCNYGTRVPFLWLEQRSWLGEHSQWNCYAIKILFTGSYNYFTMFFSPVRCRVLFLFIPREYFIYFNWEKTIDNCEFMRCLEKHWFTIFDPLIEWIFDNRIRNVIIYYINVCSCALLIQYIFSCKFVPIFIRS